MDEPLGILLDDYMNARRDFESGRAGSVPPKVPEELLDGLEAHAYEPTEEGREMRNTYWELIGHVAERAKYDYDNWDLLQDSLVKSVLDESQSYRKRFGMEHGNTSKLLSDKAARITDLHPAPGSEDARRIKELKREMDVATCIVNGGGDAMTYNSYKRLPVDHTGYEIMASMGYGPYMWEGGKPGDDKAPAFLMPSTVFCCPYDGGAYDNVTWEGSAYESRQDAKRAMYGMEHRPMHRIFDQAKNDPPTPHDRLMGTAELFRAVGDIGDVRQVWKKGTPEAERLEGIFDDYNAAVVCCNLHTRDVEESRMYAGDYRGINGYLSDVMATERFVQSPVDEWGYQMLYDLGHKEISGEELDFAADSCYDLTARDVQQLRMDRVAIDFYAGYDDRNGKLVTMAMAAQDDPLKWDVERASDYVQNECDKLLDSKGTDPVAAALRERLFDQVSASEVLLAARGDVETFRETGVTVPVVDEACYDRLKSYGYENPMLAGTGFGEAGQPQHVSGMQAESVQVPSRHLEMPDELKDNDGTDVQYE